MATVLIPIPARDFDPTEVAISWSVLRRLGHGVVFATPDGRPGQGDELMLTGQGLDVWGLVPGLRRLTLVGRVLATNAEAWRAYLESEVLQALVSRALFAQVWRLPRQCVAQQGVDLATRGVGIQLLFLLPWREKVARSAG